jgi:hypothetical protein
MAEPIPVHNYVLAFDPSRAHHRAFLSAALERLNTLDPKALQPGGDLRDLWVAAVETKARPSGGSAEAVKPSAAPRPTEVRLQVPYEAQNDNLSGTGYRECFSSSCAMVAKFWGRVSSDDAYNKIRARYGDTTDAQAQIQALRSLGIEARLLTNCAPGFLESEIRAGRPVPVGWLHKGPTTSPTGGGHWSVITGFTPTHWILNDPNGEADLLNGGYINHTNGYRIAYSRTNFNRRWSPEGVGHGWALSCRVA